MSVANVWELMKKTDVRMGNGAEWAKCVCSRWIHVDCISKTEIDEAGEEGYVQTVWFNKKLNIYSAITRVCNYNFISIVTRVINKSII